MNFKKYMIPGFFALMTMGLGSCVGDLNLEPNDPNLGSTEDPNYDANSLAMCYSGIACSGITGPGSSYVGGLDAGTSAYLRMIYTLNEFCSDEMLWIWPDEGVKDITSCTWSANNGLIQGAYYRLIGHVAICNQFLKNTAGRTDAEAIDMRAQARVLRAYSYYNMLDLFGQSSFIDENAADGAKPTQVTRQWLYDWLEKELLDIVDNNLITKTPVYGRVGLDGAEGLLARLYLNAEVFSGTPKWKECAERCENIIARHRGGFNGTGLAEHYLYLFARDNNAYMPGGSKAAENEILFGIAFDDTYTQSYGGPTFVIASTISDTHWIPREHYGCSGEWSCIRGTYEMSQRFTPNSTSTNPVIGNNDVRDDLWMRGGKDRFPGGTEYQVDENGNYVLNDNGEKVPMLDDKGNDMKYEAEDYQDRFQGFTGAWATTGGNAIIKFTGRTRNAAQDGGWDYTVKGNAQVWDCKWASTTFGSTDQPIIRLADIYLMYTECYIHDRSAAEAGKALQYINYVRQRAGAPVYGASDLSIQNLMDERSRELYHEMTRRTDLIRNNMFTGPSQTIWQYKGSMDNNEGTRIADRFNLYPIPNAVIAAQPEFKQNPGY